ncbi:MAG: hypothetical protein J7K40_15210 [candidate division Zixibacteria bacterium]|nr:hypothetical protein [candidate division Zixibacteria bacterium]
MISLKDKTVKLAGLKSEMVMASILVSQVFEKYHLGTIITAGTEEFYPDGKRIHMVGSKHITGEALDFRSRHIPDAVYSKLCSDIVDAVGGEYQLIKHENHLHLELDPE